MMPMDAQPMRLAIVLLLATTLLGCAAPTVLPSAVRIEQAGFVRIGGIDQWITIRGDDRRLPILLIVHGGPADPQSLLVDTYAPYERDFVVVQWDQRGAGRTYLRNRDSARQLSLERMARDGLDVADYLTSHLEQRRILVLGHSWGTILATAMVQRKPERFKAYVGTGQVASWRACVAEQWSELMSRAGAVGDQPTLDLMASIGVPDPMDAGQYFKWRNVLNRKYLGAADAQWLDRLRAMSPSDLGLTQDELAATGEGANQSMSALLGVQMSADLAASARQMPVPVLMIQGRDDLYTPTRPALEYFATLVAPAKSSVVIAGAGHFAMMTHPHEFSAALVAFTRQLDAAAALARR